MAEPASSSAKTPNFVVIQKHGGSILLRGGYQFYARRTHKSGLVVWACTKRKLCHGILRIKNGQIVEETLHKCIPDFARNEIDESLEKLKKDISKPNFPPVPQQFHSMLGKLKDSGIDIITKIPKFTTVKNALYRARNNEAGLPKMQQKLPLQVQVPPKYQEFMLAEYSEYTNEMRIIVFASSEARQAMSHISDFYGDGTFKSCPTPFQQLYSIHGDAGSTINNTNIMPLVYAFMSHRNTESYVILFSMIKSQLPDWNPQNFKVDYEKAAMKAIATVFPTTAVKGCYYHYNKAIYKKGRELKMTTSDDITKKRMVSLSAVLPLLPEVHIMTGWVYIIARYGDGTDDIQKKQFINYFEKNWLKEDFITVWCTFGEAHRTTNALEGWHSKLNKAVGKKNPNIMNILHIIKEDSALQAMRDIRRKEKSTLKTKRGKKAILKDEFIHEVQMELLQGIITVGHALEILRYNN